MAGSGEGLKTLDAVRGTFDVIAVLDVLYGIPIAEWDPILARAHARLREGGTLLVKEMDPEAKLKNRWNRAQEWLSEHLLHITLANAFNYESRRDFSHRLERLGRRKAGRVPPMSRGVTAAAAFAVYSTLTLSRSCAAHCPPVRAPKATRL